MLSIVVQVWSIEEFRKAQDEISDLLMENSNDNLAHTLAGGRVAFPPFAEILPALSGYDGGCLRLSAAWAVAKRSRIVQHACEASQGSLYPGTGWKLAKVGGGTHACSHTIPRPGPSMFLNP